MVSTKLPPVVVIICVIKATSQLVCVYVTERHLRKGIGFHVDIHANTTRYHILDNVNVGNLFWRIYQKDTLR